MAREDYPGTYYAYEYASDERELGAGPPSAAPVYETLTGESYELKSNLGVYTIDTSKISNFDEATQTPAKLFEQVPTPETEMERRQRLFPNTYYAHEYTSDQNEKGYIGPPSAGDKYSYELLTGEEYPTVGIVGSTNFRIDSESVVGFDESAETPAPLFETLDVGPQPTTPKYNRIYYMTPDELEALSSASSNTSGEFTYPAQYLINILKIPFKVSTDNLTDDKQTVKYSKSESSIKSYGVLDETITQDYGFIVVPEKYGNIRDYESAEYLLHLPFISDVERLEASDIVGKQVNITVSIGVYTGDATATVYTDNIETPITTLTGRMGRKVPFQNLQDNSERSASGFAESFSTFLTPYIEIRTAEIMEGNFHNMVDRAGTLEGVVGYVEASESSLEIPGATARELREIELMLSDGVYIK